MCKHTNCKMETIWGKTKKKERKTVFPLCGVENMQAEKQVSPKQYVETFQTISVASPHMVLPPLLEYSQWDILTEPQLSPTKISSGLKSIKGHFIVQLHVCRGRTEIGPTVYGRGRGRVRSALIWSWPTRLCRGAWRQRFVYARRRHSRARHVWNGASYWWMISAEHTVGFENISHQSPHSPNHRPDTLPQFNNQIKLSDDTEWPVNWKWSNYVWGQCGRSWIPEIPEMQPVVRKNTEPFSAVITKKKNPLRELSWFTFPKVLHTTATHFTF